MLDTLVMFDSIHLEEIHSNGLLDIQVRGRYASSTRYQACRCLARVHHSHRAYTTGKKSSSGVSLIKEVDSGEVVFEVEEMFWGKTRLCERRAGKVKGRVLLNIYSSALNWNWDIKGDNIEQSQTKVKPFLFKIKCETGRRPVIRIKFSVGGKKLTWRLDPDEVRL